MKSNLTFALPALLLCSASNIRATRIKAKLLIVVFSSLLLVLSSSYAKAQDTSPTPTPTEEEQQLQQEKKLIELKRDIELAKKAIRDAQPEKTEPAQPTATPLEGNAVLSEGVRFETEMVSYKAMSEVAEQITTEISTKINAAKNIAIYDGQVVKDWRFYQALFPAFQGQAEDIRDNYVDLLCVNQHSGISKYFRNTHCLASDNRTEFSRSRKAARALLKLDAISEAVGTGSTLVKSFIDLAALFRTDTKIEGKEVTINQSALVAEVLRALKNHFPCEATSTDCISLYYPGVFPPRINDGTSQTVFLIGQLFIFKTEAERLIKDRSAQKPQLVQELLDLQDEKAAAEKQLDQVKNLKDVLNNLTNALGHETIPVFRRKLWQEIQTVNVQLARLPSQSDLGTHISSLESDISSVKANLKNINDAVKSLTDLNDRFQNFVDEFVKVDEKGVNTLALFIKSENIDEIMNNDDSYWLELKSVSAGGNNRTRKNLIWFFAGPRVDHSGGAIIEYTLFNREGAVVYSDKYSYYEGYIEPKKMEKGKLKDAVR